MVIGLVVKVSLMTTGSSSGSLTRGQCQRGISRLSRTVDSPFELTHVFVGRWLQLSGAVGWKPLFFIMQALSRPLKCLPDMAAGFPEPVMRQRQRQRQKGTRGMNEKEVTMPFFFFFYLILESYTSFYFLEARH